MNPIANTGIDNLRFSVGRFCASFGRSSILVSVSMRYSGNMDASRFEIGNITDAEATDGKITFAIEGVGDVVVTIPVLGAQADPIIKKIEETKENDHELITQ